MGGYVDLDQHMDYQDYYSARLKGVRSTGDMQISALCPFHDDRTNSLSVSMKTGQFRCFVENVSGNVVDFHSRLYGLSRSQAFKEICAMCPTLLPRPEEPKAHSKKKSNGTRKPAQSPPAQTSKPDPSSDDPPVISDEDLQKTLDGLKNSNGIPMRFMTEKRGWTPEVIEKYKIGWIEEKKRQSVTIPIYDSENKLRNIRKYSKGADPKVISWKTGTGRTRLFPLDQLEETRNSEDKRIWITEGEPDTLCGISHGIRCITQTAGAETWRKDFSELFSGLNVVIAYDNDEAGRNGTESVAKALNGKAGTISAIKWPEDMPRKGDLTDWIMVLGKTVGELEALATPWEAKPDETASATTTGSCSTEGSGEYVDPLIEELNQYHAVIMIGGQLSIMYERKNLITGTTDIEFWSKDGFTSYYCNRHVLVPSGNSMKAVPLGKAWMNSIHRRQYDDIVFAPQKDMGAKVYNLYRGLGVEPKQGKKEDYSRFVSHIFEVICGSDMERYQYVMAWCSDAVQNFGLSKPGVSLVMQGAQGSGKGTFAQELGKIFGRHFLQLTNQSHITGRFNSHLKDALLVYIDEGFWAGDKQAEGTIKSLITEPAFFVEPKGKEAFMVQNHLRLIVASNNDWVVPAGELERRFCVFKVSSVRVGDWEYFRGIHEQMNNGGREAFLHYLQNLDISEFNVNKFPKTEELLEQKINSLSPQKRFYFECLCQGTLLPGGGGYNSEFGPPTWQQPVPRDAFYQRYVDVCKTAWNQVRPGTQTYLVQELSRLSQHFRIAGPMITSTTGGRKRTYFMDADLDACRKEFAERMGHKRFDFDKWASGGEGAQLTGVQEHSA